MTEQEKNRKDMAIRAEYDQKIQTVGREQDQNEERIRQLEERMEDVDDLEYRMKRFVNAKEFVTNIGNGNYDDGLYTLVDEANKHKAYLKENNNLNLKDEDIKIPERNKVVTNFITSLINNENEYVEYQKVDIPLAESMKHKGE